MIGDLDTGAGVPAAVTGVETVMHCAGSAKGDADKARHLVRARDLQARTGGFTEFVGLPFVHMATPMYLKRAARRGPTWREVLLVAGVAVGVVLGAAILTAVLPTDAQRVIFHTPLLIGVLIVGTGLVLWRLAARRPPEP